MTDPATPPAPDTVPNLADQPPLPQSTVYELQRFRYDNTPGYLRGQKPEPNPDQPVDVDADELRRLISFAGSALGNGDPRLPRTLEAHRVLQLVPDTFGAALFGVPLPS